MTNSLTDPLPASESRLEKIAQIITKYVWRKQWESIQSIQTLAAGDPCCWCAGSFLQRSSLRFILQAVARRHSEYAGEARLSSACVFVRGLQKEEHNVGRLGGKQRCDCKLSGDHKNQRTMRSGGTGYKLFDDKYLHLNFVVSLITESTKQVFIFSCKLMDQQKAINPLHSKKFLGPGFQ